MMRERMSRPSSSVPNQCECVGGVSRLGRLMDAGSCGAIHGAKIAKIKKTMTTTTPIAAKGLWRAFPRMRRVKEMAVVDTAVYLTRKIAQFRGALLTPLWASRSAHAACMADALL